MFCNNTCHNFFITTHNNSPLVGQAAQHHNHSYSIFLSVPVITALWSEQSKNPRKLHCLRSNLFLFIDDVNLSPAPQGQTQSGNSEPLWQSERRKRMRRGERSREGERETISWEKIDIVSLSLSWSHSPVTLAFLLLSIPQCQTETGAWILHILLCDELH